MSNELSGVNRPEARLLTSMVGPLPNNHPFEVFVDGEPIDPGRGLLITSPWGSWTLGKRPEGYPGVLYREPEGGGTITIPYVRAPNGEILVAMILENRPNMGGPVWCAIGGMIDGVEPRKTTQVREADEESGLDTTAAAELPGVPVLQDRLIYVADIHKGEGIHLFFHELPFDDLEAIQPKGWKPRRTLIKRKAESPVYFFAIRDATLKSADTLMHSAILRLMVALDMV